MAKKTSKTAASTGGLARVGTQSSGLPSSEADPKGRGKAWWRAGKTGSPTGNQSGGNAPAGAWPASAKDELSQFKNVPVVGRLPWKSQYVVLGVLLSLGLAALAVMALGSGSGPASSAPAAAPN